MLPVSTTSRLAGWPSQPLPFIRLFSDCGMNTCVCYAHIGLVYKILYFVLDDRLSFKLNNNDLRLMVWLMISAAVALPIQTTISVPTFSQPIPVISLNRWIVFLYRFDGNVDFNRTWAEYRNGFGDVTGEYWLGLEKLTQMTNNGNTEHALSLNLFRTSPGFHPNTTVSRSIQNLTGTQSTSAGSREMPETNSTIRILTASRTEWISRHGTQITTGIQL